MKPIWPNRCGRDEAEERVRQIAKIVNINFASERLLLLDDDTSFLLVLHAISESSGKCDGYISTVHDMI